MKKGDIGALFFSIFILLLFSSFVYSPFSGNDKKLKVHIKCGNEEWYYPLESDNALTVHGPVGNTIIAIENNSARVTTSDCIGKVCIHQGRIMNQGQWIACLPNSVMITIEGNKEPEIDAYSY